MMFSRFAALSAHSTLLLTHSAVVTGFIIWAGVGAQPGYRQDVQFPKKYRNSTVFIAEHGSTDNPMQPGFRVAAVVQDKWMKGTSRSHFNFASGWLSNDGPWGELSTLSCFFVL